MMILVVALFLIAQVMRSRLVAVKIRLRCSIIDVCAYIGVVVLSVVHSAHLNLSHHVKGL